jgi:hypothetical protein
LAHFADSSWISPEVREVPLPDSCSAANMVTFSIILLAMPNVGDGDYAHHHQGQSPVRPARLISTAACHASTGGSGDQAVLIAVTASAWRHCRAFRPWTSLYRAMKRVHSLVFAHPRARPAKSLRSLNQCGRYRSGYEDAIGRLGRYGGFRFARRLRQAYHRRYREMGEGRQVLGGQAGLGHQVGAFGRGVPYSAHAPPPRLLSKKHSMRTRFVIYTAVGGSALTTAAPVSRQLVTAARNPAVRVGWGANGAFRERGFAGKVGIASTPANRTGRASGETNVGRRRRRRQWKGGTCGRDGKDQSNRSLGEHGGISFSVVA